MFLSALILKEYNQNEVYSMLRYDKLSGATKYLMNMLMCSVENVPKYAKSSIFVQKKHEQNTEHRFFERAKFSLRVR